jgi:predicted amidohydrolase YtcJ
MHIRIRKSIPQIFLITVLFSFLFWTGFTYAAADQDSLKVDKILFNGKVVTIDNSFSIAQAVAIKGDKIVAVGTNAQLKRLKGTKTQMIDLKGKTLIPGFNEGHMHTLTTGLGLSKVNLQESKIKTMSDLVNAVGDRAKTSPKGDWVEGWGWDQSKLEENRFPTRWDLDKVSPDNPVFLMRTCNHIVVANSKALELAGITKETPQPVGGEIVRDEKGEPTGAFLERPAFTLVQKLIPKPDVKKKKEALRAASKALNASGVTSVNDGGSYAEDYQAYQELLNDGGLTVRVYAMPWLALHEISDEEAISYINHLGPRQGFGNDYLKIGALKIVMDGGIGGRTALMRMPYITGNPGNFGIQSVPQERLRKFIKLANQKGWQMAIHSCGGKAMDNVLEIFKEADQEKSIKGRRWYFVHAYDPSPQNIEDMRRMEVGAATNPSFIYFLGDSFISNMGKEWGYHASPHKEYLENGIHISGGSDSPVSPYTPLWGIYGAVARKTQLSKEVAGADQRISIQDALRIFTMGGAWMTFEEKTKGSIEPGKLADVVILGEDILTVDPERIPKIPIIATFVGGKVVYLAPGAKL